MNIFRHFVPLFSRLLLLLCIALPLTAQQHGIRFERISIEQGLSQSSVFSVFQDSKGFLWFGTLDGLNKYDGYRFTVYRSDPRDTNTLSNNTIVRLFEDAQGFLWIGTLGGGLNRFDAATERFERFRHNPKDPHSISNDNVRSILQDAEGALWIGTNNGLNRFDPVTRRFTRYYHDPAERNSLSNNVIWSLFESSRAPGILWVGTYNGLNRFDTKQGTFTRYQHDPKDAGSLSNNYVWSIIAEDSLRCWIGTNAGLNLFNTVTGRSERFLHENGDPSSISGNNVWSLYKDSTGIVYAGTLDGGLNRILPLPGGRYRFLSYRHHPGNPHSISHNFIWSIIGDRTGIIWLGTDLGINKFDPNGAKFRHFRSEPFDPFSLSNNEVTALFRDRSDVLWVGTRDGLNRYDAATGRFRHYRNDPKDVNSISSNYIRSIHEDRRGRLWIGTNGGGLNMFDRTRSSFHNTKNGRITSSISSNDITRIHEDDNGILWLGTLAGLNRYDPATGAVKFYARDPDDPRSLSHDYVYSICQTRDGAMWIGTLGGGLNLFDPDSGRFLHFMEDPADTSSLSNNNVWNILEDRNGDLWIGTNNGLNKYDRKRRAFLHVDERSGLVNNVIYGILEDGRGNLWLSSNKGLTRYTPATGAVRHYTAADGLQSDQFGGNDQFRDRHGYLHFGGINGFNIFYPDSIRDNPHLPPIVLTDFQIFNRSVGVGGDSPLQRSISSAREIVLSHDQNVFSFEFAALHFSSPPSNSYAYIMEGFDKEWTMAGPRRFVTYTNLDPGRYTFRVTGSNNDGIWNTAGTSIDIIITPPFWKTWWFITLVVLFLLSVAGAVIHVQFRHLLAMERLRLKIASDLHDDIGTRLTEISLLSDMVYHGDHTAPESVKESVRSIGGIARALIENMSDIVWLINPKRDSLYELFLKLRDSYEEILSYKQILLYINDLRSMEAVALPMEHRQNIYLIFKEAINNAIKHSRCTEISINTELHGRSLIITMYDNGTGFDPAGRRTGNGLENMQRRAEAVGGTLRINATAGNGTMIRFQGTI
ncbi:MAG: histidine kinase [Bacteroidetes bacterium]|nr:histidine kinase [Bacteroidota bacterium]